MASTSPFDRLTGVVSIYIAPQGETVTAVNATPAGNWVKLGATDGEQSLQSTGKLTYFQDNDHQGNVKAVRPLEDEIVKFKLVGLSLENYARIMDMVSDVVAAVGPPATKKVPLKRGPIPMEYALLFKGSALSPYGAYPGQYVIPRGVFDVEPTETFARDGSPALECEFHALEDDAQVDADRLGWLIVQTA
jgi:predicted secreted protein